MLFLPIGKPAQIKLAKDLSAYASGAEFREKSVSLHRSLEVAKNSHMRVPVGNSACRGRPRAAHTCKAHMCICGEI